MTDNNITKDVIYEAVAPDDFESMLHLDRYGNRSTAFDKIISATHDHFWDPLDPKYIDFDEPFDMENEAIMPETMVGAQASQALLDLRAENLRAPLTRTVAALGGNDAPLRERRERCADRQLAVTARIEVSRVDEVDLSPDCVPEELPAARRGRNQGYSNLPSRRSRARSSLSGVSYVPSAIWRRTRKMS